MVARVLSLLYKEVKGLHQAAYVLALFTFASQILAIVRDRTLAHQFGAGYELDLYYAAFRIPDLLFVLFASVLSVYVLLPFVVNASNSKAGRQLLSQVFTLFLVSYSALAVLIFITAPLCVPFLFPGFDAVAHAQIVDLMRILLLQPLLLGISSLCGVITQLQHRFIIYAISPLLYNIGIIIGVAVFYEWWGLQGLVWGVVLGAFGHVAIQVPLILKSELRFSLASTFDGQKLWELAKVATPRALTLSLHQIQFLLFVMMASLMAVGSVSVLQFAFNLQSVPLAIIGVSYSVAAFPTLAELLAKQKQQDFNLYVLTAIRHIIFWSLPIITLVIVLRAQIVRVLLGSGSFDWDDTRLTAAVLAVFVVTLTMQAALLLLTRALYAGGKTMLPLVLACIGVTVGAGSAWAMYWWFTVSEPARHVIADILRLRDVVGVEVLALPIGFTLGVLIELLLMVIVCRRIFLMSYRPVYRTLFVSTVSALVGGIAAYGTLSFIVKGINQETFIGIFMQGLVGASVGILAVIITHLLLHSKEMHEVYTSFKARLFKTDVVAPQPEVL
ncbi:MAG: murein biosynthesis integral membrane protein MurJ [Candidatus Paceibacteria bacterium]